MEWQSCHFCSSAVAILSLYSFHHFQIWDIFSQCLHSSIFNLCVKIDHFFPLVGRIHHLFQVTRASSASVNWLAEWRGICCVCAVISNYFCSSCKWKHQPDVTALLHSTIQTCSKFVFSTWGYRCESVCSLCEMLLTGCITDVTLLSALA